MFQVDGPGGRVVWRNGTLSGDAAACARVEEMAALGYEVCATPTGPCWVVRLADPVSVLLAAVQVCGPGAEAAGDVPDVPGVEVPEGAVA